MPQALHDPGFYNAVLREPPVTGDLGDRLPGGWRNGLLVRAPNWLGDTLMCLPAVRQINRRVPTACGLVVLCPKGLAPVWRACPWVDAVVPLDGKRTGRKAATLLQRMRLGVAVVLPNSFGSALDVWGKGIPVRLGRGGRGRDWLLTHRLPAWRRSGKMARYHQASHYFEIAAALGPVDMDCRAPLVAVPAVEYMADRLGANGGATQELLALAPGAAYGPAKQWDVGRFVEVARWWRRRNGTVVIVGAEQERPVGRAIAEDVPDVLDLTGRTSLTELMWVLGKSRCVVANDSGAMHLAAALGTPGVAVFGSTDPVATGPLGAPWVIAHHRVACAPCFRRLCARTDSSYLCLRQVTVAEVCDGIERILVHVDDHTEAG